MAADDRFAKGGDAPHRMSFGQPTQLRRALHDFGDNFPRDNFRTILACRKRLREILSADEMRIGRKCFCGCGYAGLNARNSSAENPSAR